MLVLMADSVSFCAAASSRPTSTYSVPSGPVMLLNILVPTSDWSVICLVTEVFTRSTVSLLAAPVLSTYCLIMFSTCTFMFCASCTRPSVAAICFMNAMPASDLAAAPTAPTAMPSTGPSQTQIGAGLSEFGNTHSATGATLAGALEQPAKPSNATAENSTQLNSRIKTPIPLIKNKNKRGKTLDKLDQRAIKLQRTSARGSG